MTWRETVAPRYAVGRVCISAVTMDKTLQLLDKQVKKGGAAYVCVANRMTAILSQKDSQYCQIQNKSFLTIPDGMPLVWLARLAGLRGVQRVTGPDLMIGILERSADRGYSHYFLGDTEETLLKLHSVVIARYHNVDIRGMLSPPFRHLSDAEIGRIASEINQLKPTFVWVALGAPKQERFIARMFPQIEGAILIGVGAAFRFMLGEYRHPPRIVQTFGLEGFCWRFWRAPIYYTRRYIVDALILVWLAARMLVERTRRRAD